MIDTIASMFLNVAGLAWDAASAGVRWYGRALVKVTLAGVTGIAVFYGGIWAHSSLIVATGVLAMMVALVLANALALPVTMPLELAAEKWAIVKRRLDFFSTLVFQGVLLAFYIVVDDGARMPKMLVPLLGLYVLEWLSFTLPSDAWPIQFFRRRVAAYLVIGAAVLLTAGRVLPLSVQQVANRYPFLETIVGVVPEEILFTLDERRQIVEATGRKPIKLFAQIGTNGSQPEPLVGKVVGPDGRYRLYSWYPGQVNRTTEGGLIEPLTVADVEVIKAQAELDISRAVDATPNNPVAKTPVMERPRARSEPVAKAESTVVPATTALAVDDKNTGPPAHSSNPAETPSWSAIDEIREVVAMADAEAPSPPAVTSHKSRGVRLLS